jgi:hypothetical protein
MTKPKHPNNLGIALGCGFVIFVAVTTLLCGQSPLDFFK